MRRESDDLSAHPRGPMRLSTAIFSSLVLAATPVVVWWIMASMPVQLGQPPATLVVGVSFSAGLAMGGAYQLTRVRQHQRQSRTTGDGVAAGRRSSLSLWGAASAAGAGLVAQALFPRIAGVEIGLIAVMLGAGLLLPAVPGFLMRVARRGRAKTKEGSA